LSKEYNTKVYLKKTYATLAHIKSIIPLDKFYLPSVWVKLVLSLKLGLDSTVLQQQLYVLMGLQCIVYMGEVDIKRQAPNVARMKMLGSPSTFRF
jgi:tryptophan synthase beta chain